MTFNRKATLPKGAFLMMKNNSGKVPQGFDLAKNIATFNPFVDVENLTNCIFYQTGVGGSTPATLEYQEGGEHLEDKRLSLSTGSESLGDAMSAIFAHKVPRKSGIYRIPFFLSCLSSYADAASHNEIASFSVGVVVTDKNYQIDDTFDFLNQKKAFFTVHLRDAGIDGNGFWGHPYAMYLPIINLVQTLPTPMNNSLDCSSVYYSNSFIDSNFESTFIVDIDNKRVGLETRFNDVYNFSGWLDMECDFDIACYLYLAIQTDENLRCEINIDDMWDLSGHDANDIPYQNQTMKTDGYFLKESPRLVVKK